MESYKCKFCFKSFFNGRALGGHMRSHMPNLYKFSVHEEQEEETEDIPSQLSDETESDVSSSSFEQEEERNDFLLQEDGEIETNIVNLTRKRSKRTRKLDSFVTTKKMKTSQLGYKTEPETEPLHSSASDTTTEEDLAFCLMMLSRDKWKKKKKEEIETEESEDYKKSKIITTKGRYKCETCGKMFKSYQALGGHRASHKKNRVSNNKTEQDNVVLVTEKRIHECPICLRVFASGQALGGHKRSHGIGNLTLNRCYNNNNNQVQRNERMIDLNLPAPNEEEEVSVVFQ